MQKALVRGYAMQLQPLAQQGRSKAPQRGLGVRPNLIEAYAWLQLFADSPEGSIVGRVELNTLALKLDTAGVRRAQQLAAQFKAGKWQRPVIRLTEAAPGNSASSGRVHAGYAEFRQSR